MKRLGTQWLMLAAFAFIMLFGWLILSVWSAPTHASTASRNSSAETAVPTTLPTAVDPNSGYPLALGNTWVYSSTRYEGFNARDIMTATQTITETVVEVKNTLSFFAAWIRQETSADTPVSVPKDMEDMLRPASTTEYWLIAQDNRIYRQERKEPDPTNLHDPDSLELVFPLQFGDRWNWLPARPPSEPQTGGIKREVVRTGSVFLPSSHFDNCSLIKEDWADSTVKDWFCPGVGWVEKDSDHNGTPVGWHTELVKFWLSNSASGPTPNGAPLLSWQDEQHGCKSLVVGADDSAQYGACSSLQTVTSVAGSGGYWDRWNGLAGRFAPFQMRDEHQELVFHGQGKESASPAWQQAIAAWAVVAEQQLEMRRTGASWAAALAWSEPIADRPGYCRGLQIESYGYAYTSTATCEGGDPQNVAEGWLDDSEWEQFDGWYYGRAAFERDKVKFFGRGTLEMSAEELAQIEQWVQAVYARLDAGPSQTRAPTPTPPETSIHDVYPLSLGASWLYSATVETEENHTPVRWTGLVTDTVIGVREQSGASIFDVERQGTPPGLVSWSWLSSFQYVALGNRLYQLNPPTLPDSLIAKHGQGYEGLQRITWPLNVGDKWGAPEDIWRGDGLLVWRVEEKADLKTPAGTFSGCYRLLFLTNPDDTTVWFCPGVGIAKREYHHHGSVLNEAWELKERMPGAPLPTRAYDSKK